MNHSSKHTKIEYLTIYRKIKYEKDRQIEGNIIKDIRNLLRPKKEITEEIEDNIVIIILNMKVMMIKINRCQLSNILIELDHT